MSDVVKSITLGQGDDCDIRVDDPYVSGLHARIRQRGDGTVWIEDMGSTNGTYVQRGTDKFRVYEPARLLPGDVLWLGGRTSIPWTKL